MNIVLISIPTVVCILAFVAYRRANHGVAGPVGFIIGLYAVTGVIAIVLEVAYPTTAGVYEVQLTPMLYLTACFLLTFWGVSSFRGDRFAAIEIENISLFRALESALLIFGAAGIVFFAPYAIAAMTGDIRANRQSMYVVSLLQAHGVVNSVFSLVGNLFILNIICAFMNLSGSLKCRRGAKRRAIALLATSTVYIIYILAYVGRDGFVYWTMTFVLVYLLFRPFLSSAGSRLVHRLAVAVVSCAAVPFAAITYARAGYTLNPVIQFVLTYAGTQVRQFNDHFLAFSVAQGGRMNFPMIMDLIGRVAGWGPMAEFDRRRWYTLYTSVDVSPWTFSTFIGSFLHDFGYVITPFAILTIALVARRSLRGLRRRGSITFAELLVFVLCSQVVSWGVFYFRQYSANLYLLAMAGLALTFSLLGRVSQPVIVTRSVTQPNEIEIDRTEIR